MSLTHLGIKYVYILLLLLLLLVTKLGQ